MAETFSEGLRYTDLLRWRSFDNMLSDKWIPEGVNFWDGMYRNYMVDSDGNEVELVADGYKGECRKQSNACHHKEARYEWLFSIVGYSVE